MASSASCCGVPAAFHLSSEVLTAALALSSFAPPQPAVKAEMTIRRAPQVRDTRGKAKRTADSMVHAVAIAHGWELARDARHAPVFFARHTDTPPAIGAKK